MLERVSFEGNNPKNSLEMPLVSDRGESRSVVKVKSIEYKERKL